MATVRSVVLCIILINMMANIQGAPTNEELAKQIAEALAAPDEPITTTPVPGPIAPVPGPPMMVIDGVKRRKFDVQQNFMSQFQPLLA